jgi:hypothetical protein
VTEAPNDLYELVEVNNRTEPPTETVLSRTCFPPEAAPPVTPPPPPPPTLAEITAIAQEAIPVPEVTLNPRVDGLTGLDTWLWHDGPTEVSATASVRGYAVTATMTAGRFYWDMDGAGLDPRNRLVEAAHPGSEAQPAATHLYELKGDYQVLTQVVWDGTWTFTGPGSAIASGTLPTIRATGSRAYHVAEATAVLVD